MLTETKPLPGFVEWLEANQMELDTVSELLAERLSDNPVVLFNQITQIEAWGARMTTLLAEANTFLDIAEKNALLSREEHWTDLDRRVHQRACVVNERRIRDILEGICEAIRTRTILGMSLRKASAGEASKNET